ncbi:apolipoprotein A-I-like [Pelobates fuscus]|uniref:apolipoprotein A-I-like n=1 Tax=Pelobates fuscus TaxID=191477 RepID=UPI002FE44B98
MKILILTLSVLFISGTHGRFLWQRDEPKSDISDVFEKFVENIVELGSEAADYVKSTSNDKEQKIRDTIDALKTNCNDIKQAIKTYLHSAWKQVDKELDEKYPVLKKDVLPHLEEFGKQWDEYAMNMKKDIFIYTLNLFNGLKNQVEKFFENIRPVAEKGRDKLRSEVEELRNKIAPYLEDLKKELEKNRKELHGEWSKDYIAQVEKEIDELRESIKPHLENLKKSVVPHAKNVEQYLDKIVQEIRKSLYLD